MPGQKEIMQALPVQRQIDWKKRGDKANAQLEELVWTTTELAKLVELGPGVVMALEEAVNEITKHLQDEAADIRAEGNNCWAANDWLNEYAPEL